MRRICTRFYKNVFEAKFKSILQLGLYANDTFNHIKQLGI